MELGYLIAHARPHGGKLALLAILSGMASLATLAIPWLAGQLIGGAMRGSNIPADRVIGLLVLALLALSLLTMASCIVSSATSARILAGLRSDIHRHIQTLPMEFHDRNRQGDLLALMSYEIERLSQFLANTLTNIPSMLLTAGGAVILLFWIDPLLALAIPLVVPGFYLALKLVGRRMRSIAQARQEAEAAVMAQAEENLEMLPAIKAFAREEIQANHYASLVDHARKLYVDEARIYAVLGPAISLLSALAAVMLLVLGSRKLGAGGMNPSELFSFLFYAALLTRPVASLSNIYGQFQTARGTLGRLQRVLGEPAEPGYSASRTIERIRGEIVFENLWFTFPGREPTLCDVNLTVSAGDVVALTGENGAGKSTLVNLLLRFYIPQRGTIRLDGVDIARLQVEDLRRQIGYVPQRPLLFSGSIRANIAFGLEGASDARIEAAARLAQAWEFITQLPQGFETEIGDHGIRLSGGQRQRIALARALLKDPPLLILDEVTSMYDLEGEAAFVHSCRKALEGRTVLLITHRPASLALANRIVEVHSGRVTEVL